MKAIAPDRLVRLYAALMVASVAFALAGLTWRLIGFAGTADSAAVPVTDRSSAGAHPSATTDLSAMVRLAPFGKSEPGAAVPTRLPLTLRGVIEAQPAEASTAWIVAADGKVVSYRVGSPVPGGATLAAVAKDHVLLEIGGAVERLEFPRPKEAPRRGNAGGTAPPVTAEDTQTNE